MSREGLDRDWYKIKVKNPLAEEMYTGRHHVLTPMHLALLQVLNEQNKYKSVTELSFQQKEKEKNLVIIIRSYTEALRW